MGCVCCCFCVEDPEENNATNSHTRGHNCYAFFIHSLFNKSNAEERNQLQHKIVNGEIGQNKAIEASDSEVEDDECPTCLEEYNYDNPRILTNCNHHFHLGCIYEWKERSDSCPVCGKNFYKPNKKFQGINPRISPVQSRSACNEIKISPPLFFPFG